MNNTTLVGNLTKNPELTSTQTGISRCVFTVAVPRKYKNTYGERKTDFIPCIAWRNTAEFIGKYFSKGQKIGVVGSIQVESWTDETPGKIRYRTDVVVDEAYFVESKVSQQASKQQSLETFENEPEGLFEEDNSDLPFDI